MDGLLPPRGEGDPVSNRLLERFIVHARAPRLRSQFDRPVSLRHRTAVYCLCREPGALLALALFGGQPVSGLDPSFTAAEWRAAVDGYVAAGATLGLAVGDSPAGLDISVPLTIDIVWFLARGALLARWMDLNRGRRLDSTNALPMMPVCLEVCRMATRCIARDEGLATRVAETLVELLFVAGEDCRDDTPSQRVTRAELMMEITDERAAHPLPL
jgi:hypothetical protein